MKTSRILAIIQAGGAGGRMDVLTLERAKPALPFAGSYQLLDFPLSNLVNSRIDEVWLSVAYQASAREEQVRNGRPWDLDRTHGGLRLLVPQQGTGSMDEEGFAKGNADELYRLRDQIRTAAPDVVIVMSADHGYRLDYRDVVSTHQEKGAEVTMVTTDLEGRYAEDVGDHAVVEVNRLGRVTSCRGWSTAGRSTPTSSTATGATWASYTTTSTPTWSCSTRTPGSSGVTGRSAPSSPSASRPASCRAPRSARPCSARAASSPERSPGACSVPVWWSRREPRSPRA